MAKTKTRKSILKGVAAGFACMMCCAFFPANAIASAAEYNGDEARTNVSTIQVDGAGQSYTIKEGQYFTIPTASYTHNGQKYDFASDKMTEAGITSSVSVVYKSTGEEVKVEAGKFVASKVGTYVVTYEVVREGVSYTYDLTVVAQATKASFDFEANAKNVIPSVYDVTYADGKDVILPLPTVKGEDEETLLASDIENFVIESNKANAGDVYVKISLTNGATGVEIKEKEITNDKGETEKVYYIAGSDISAKNDAGKYTYEGQTFKIVYSFFQKVEGSAIYVASTSKSFTVKSNYYYQSKDKADDKRGYELDGTFSTTFPDSATVGVEKTLPGVVATTKADNSPATETVAVHYQIQVIKANDKGSYSIDEGAKDVTSDVITEGNKFTAKEEGSYKFIYTATDFYGNKVDADTITRTITNVKDTISASVFMYDAKNSGFDAEKKTYESAENLLKTKAVNRNVIIYAIGGTDNMVAQEDITLRREIRNYGGTPVYVINQKEYHAYNLVFAPALSEDVETEGLTEAQIKEAKENALYKQIVSDNYALRSQMILAKQDSDDPATIKAYMKGAYLIVTNEFNKDIFGNTLVEGLELPSKDDAEYETKMAAVRTAMIEKGYAYIPAEDGQNAKLTANKYTVRYFANDNVNKNTETKLTAKDIEFTTAYNDEIAPTLTFSSDLQASYLPTDKFTFNVAAVSDEINQDNRISAVTAYRYLDGDKAPIADANAKGTLAYYVQRYNDKVVDEGKWYAKTGVTPEAHAAGWYVDAKATSYTVDLTEKPKAAAYVEIFAYATDDYGNTGFFNKIVSIADATDEDMPTLSRAVTSEKSYSAPDEVELPTLTFTDDKIALMTAQVAVYRVAEDGTKTKVASKGMTTSKNPSRNTFTVKGGYFQASLAGKYQVAITVVDAGNHSVTSYFEYNVAEGTTEELKPTIDNLVSMEDSAKTGTPYYLAPPSISMVKDDAYGYIGIEKDDDANTATWYNVSAISATSNDYIIENNTYFTANSEGTYKLKYTAYLMQYKLSELTAEKTANKLFFGKDEFENTKLKYYDGTTEYFVYLDETENYALAITENLDGTGASLNASVLSGKVEKHIIENDSIITLTVASASLSVNDNSMDLHYKDQDEYKLEDSIEIIKPIVDFNGNVDIDEERTTVTITKNSTTLASIKLSEWADNKGISLKDYVKVEDGKISLIFKDDGKYTISYKVEGTVGAGDTYSVTLSAGDVVAPELEIGDNILNEKSYNVDTPLSISFSNKDLDDSILSFSDINTNEDELLETLVVKIKYEDGAYEELENVAVNSDADKAEGKVNYVYNYEFEQKGKYTLSFTITDKAGNKTTKYKEIEVGVDEASSADVAEIMGGVLIGLSVVLLAGVVVYFVASKKKLDKKEKSYRRETKSKK